MLAPRPPERMTMDEFLRWEQRQEQKHELIDGVPVLRAIRKGWVGPKAMTGGARRHTHIATRISHALMLRLVDGPCQPATADLQVRVTQDRSRYPDVVIDCGPIDARLHAEDPRVVFEVLSPSNDLAEQLDLIDDYKQVTSIEQIVFVEQRSPVVLWWVRAGELWPRREVKGLEQVLPIPAFGLELPLAEFYKGVTFDV